MLSINTHINFNGNALEAFEFYRSVFGGEFTKLIRLGDISSPDFEVAEVDTDKILSIRLPIGNAVLIGNDVPTFMGKVSEAENRSKIAIFADTKGEADKLFEGLSVGGTVEMPLEDGFLGYFGAFRDKFGIEWTIQCES
jgi:PhnB protein